MAPENSERTPKKIADNILNFIHGFRYIFIHTYTYRYTLTSDIVKFKVPTGKYTRSNDKDYAQLHP